jgi:cytochrome c-type biogenesis protein CcmF
MDLGLRSTVINLGPDYFPPVVRPFLIGIFILMGIAPLAAWRRSTAQRLGRSMLIPLVLSLVAVALLFATGTDNIWALFGFGLVAFAGFATITEIWKGVAARSRRGENYWKAFSSLVGRDRHRYGGYFIHLAIVILGMGVIGSTSYQKITQQTLNVGDRLKLGPYTMQYNGLFSAQGEDGRTMTIAKATVYKNGKIVDHIQPRRDTFFTFDPSTNQLTPSTNMSIPGAYRTWNGDFYAIITFWEGNRVTFRVYLNPLINFVWIGGILLLVGTLVALWPSRRPELGAQAASVPAEWRGAEASGGR